jgi:hypothetical protein
LEVSDSERDGSAGEDFVQELLNTSGGGAEHNDPAE